MSWLVKHSAVGTLLSFARTGKISYRRGGPLKTVSPASTSINSETPRASGSAEDVSELEKAETEIAVTNIVDWSGPDDPSNPQNWPFRHKLIVTAVLWYV